MKWTWAFGGLMSSAAMLLPLPAAAESHVQMKVAGTRLSATAHVEFKIVIPKVLYLDAGSGSDPIEGVRTVGIFSNGHNVTLAATVRASDDAHANVILSAATRKIIAQDAACTVGSSRPAAASAQPMRVLCTASMP
jgi:hypothetical protein